MVVHNQEEMGEGSAMPTDPHHTPTIIQSSTSQPQKTQKPTRPKRKDTEVPQPSGPTTNVAYGLSIRRWMTVCSPGTSSGGGPRHQETIGDTIAHTRVLDLETTKTTQANEIASLKRRVKKLEQKSGQELMGLKGEDASKQGMRITDIDDDEDITLINDQDDADMFDVNTLTGDEVLTEPEVAVKDVNLSIDEVTLAQALTSFKSAKDSAATTTATIPTLRKGIVFQEPEPEKPMKKKELIKLDEEITSKLQAEFDEEVRLAREKAKKEQEANVSLTEELDDIQAKIEADHELAQRLQA
ncbi:hypothetical protein Tco_0558386 [Tanacetum coccineum]